MVLPAYSPEDQLYITALYSTYRYTQEELGRYFGVSGATIICYNNNFFRNLLSLIYNDTNFTCLRPPGSALSIINNLGLNRCRCRRERNYTRFGHVYIIEDPLPGDLASLLYRSPYWRGRGVRRPIIARSEEAPMQEAIPDFSGILDLLSRPSASVIQEEIPDYPQLIMDMPSLGSPAPMDEVFGNENLFLTPDEPLINLSGDDLGAILREQAHTGLFYSNDEVESLIIDEIDLSLLD